MITFPHQFITTLLLLLIIVTTTTTTQFILAQQGEICDSTFHKTRLDTVVTNPPIQPTDIALLTETAKHYQLECFFMNQIFPVSGDRSCASPPNQRLQLCHQPASNSPRDTASWTCVDISQFLNTQFYRIVVGSSSGPELRIKITWFSSLTNVNCYPRTFQIWTVGLPVPEPGTSIGASIAFPIIVGIVAVAVVVYGFYALWRVSKKFEHREHQNNNNGSPSAFNGAREQYRAALAALGAPEHLVEGATGLYDEDADEENDDEELRNQFGAEKIGEFDDDEEEFDEDEEGGWHFNNDKNNIQEHGDGQFVVLDNDQVLRSAKKPVPWFERMQQQSLRNQQMHDRDNLGFDEVDDDQFYSSSQQQQHVVSTPPKSAASRRQQVNNISYMSPPEDHHQQQQNKTPPAVVVSSPKKSNIPPPPASAGRKLAPPPPPLRKAPLQPPTPPPSSSVNNQQASTSRKRY